LNVAIAGLCATVVDFKNTTEQINVTKSPADAWWISDARRTSCGVTQSVRRALRPDSYGVSGDMYTLDFDDKAMPLMILTPGQTLEGDALTSTATLKTLPAFLAIEPWKNSSGWPMRSMCCWVENLGGYPSSNATSTRGPLRLVWGWNPFKVRLGPDAKVLPLRPIWSGFIINTIFYAVLVASLVSAFQKLRSRRRMRKRLCPRCAYPVGASPVCTECGEPLTAFK
jgi:hypothetical protein